MRKETDLARVKMIAHVLLDMPIAQTPFSPAIVSHPFTSTGVTAAQNEDGNITVVDLLNNKEDYGFILRYPAGKEPVTGISHEPWHFRYVGVPHARLMVRLGLTLEEYVDLLRRDFVRRDLTFRAGRRDFRIRYYAGADRGPLPEEPGRYRQVSEDNCGGLVVTAWR